MTKTLPTAQQHRELALSGQLAQNAQAIKSAPSGRFVLEPKLDGWRILAEIAEDGCHFYSRSGKEYTHRGLAYEMADIFPVGTWFDGEMVGENWGSVQSEMTDGGSNASNLRYVVFDVLAIEGIDARSLPLSSRRTLLNDMFHLNEFAYMELIFQLPTASDENVQRLLSEEYEGGVVKALDAPYGSGRRGGGWFKIKPQETMDVVVMGFKSGARGPCSSIVFGQYVNGKLKRLGSCSGYKQSEAPDESWVGTVIEIAYHGGIEGLRHPQFKRRRPDKRAEDC